jgi:hypothetical protein
VQSIGSMFLRNSNTTNFACVCNTNCMQSINLMQSIGSLCLRNSDTTVLYLHQTCCVREKHKLQGINLVQSIGSLFLRNSNTTNFACVCDTNCMQGINLVQSIGSLFLRNRNVLTTLQDCVNLEGMQRLNAYAARTSRYLNVCGNKIQVPSWTSRHV